MIYEIERFGTDLQSPYYHESELRTPPLTYEAYNAALKRHLYEIKNEVIKLEKNIMKQGKLRFSSLFFVVAKFDLVAKCCFLFRRDLQYLPVFIR